MLRIDDLDTARNVSGADTEIIKTLQCFGLLWDDSIVYQSQHIKDYECAIQALSKLDVIYPCSCSRKKLQQYRLSHPGNSIYPGFCRQQSIKPGSSYALRLKTTTQAISFHDQLQGDLSQSLALTQGDFIVQRRDKIFAYQLAVVIDDAIQQVSEVVRGIDILDSTFKQIQLQQLLGHPSPQYMHIPVITNQAGEKLSKQTYAQAVDHNKPSNTLVYLLELLQQQPPKDLQTSSVDDVLSWAIQNWQPKTLKKLRAIKRRID